MTTITIKRNRLFASSLRKYLNRVHLEAGSLSFIESKTFFVSSFEIKGSVDAIELMQNHLKREGL